MNLRIYTNNKLRSDFIFNGIDNLMRKTDTINIAVAFLTDTDILKELNKRGCNIRIIVRLGYPTLPYALENLLKMERVEARFYSDRTFHPKLYIFGSSGALVGSANLTKSAMFTNQEIMIQIDPEDNVFSQLLDVFSEYWAEANVLTKDIVKKYDDIYNQYKSLNGDESRLEEKVQKYIGKVIFSNITRDKENKTKENIFIEDYRKTYQETVNAFRAVRSVYENVGARKVDEKHIPLRLEIDSFISFVREAHAKKDKWETTPIISGEKQIKQIRELIEEWHETPRLYFENTIVNENYPRLLSVFDSEDSICKSTPDEMFHALCTLHSFHDRLRYFDGGLDTLKNEFLGKNKIDKIKSSLSYLVFGKEDVIERMAKLIFDIEYKLNVFGQANVQELIGWQNKEELPVVNSRTTKVLRYLGFDVRQL
ncbi:MAG: NgoFVII family restriction endonuclease [Syntrophaceae bacterium]|nr:NgoFVII family restriction endonuclease [Syntrophaceae bacterium]